MFKLHHLKSIAVSAGLFAAMLFCPAPGAAAQGLPRIVIDVPFEFIVNGKTLPAGRYSVTAVHPDSGYVLYIKKDGTNEGTAFTTSAAVNMGAPNKIALIFHHYGSDHYLAEVWTGSNNIGYRLPVSQGELTAARISKPDESNHVTTGPSTQPSDSKGASTTHGRPADSKGSPTGQSGKAAAPSKSS
jgi:hypothetical protein